MNFSDIDWKSTTTDDVLTIINSGVNINDRCKCPLNDPDDYNLPSLSHAIRAGANLEIIQTLIDNGADVNHGFHGGFTPFYFAVDRSDIDIIKAMIEAGGYMNADYSTCCLDSPLSWARTAEVVDILVKAGADVNANRVISSSHIDQKNVHKNDEVVQALIDAGAQVNIQSTDGRLPIHEAVNAFATKEIAWVLHLRSTPLHNVCRRITDNINTVKTLIDNGADVNATDSKGNSCLHICAMGNKSPELIQLLVDNGAYKSFQNNAGQTMEDFMG